MSTTIRQAVINATNLGSDYWAGYLDAGPLRDACTRNDISDTDGNNHLRDSLRVEMAFEYGRNWQAMP